MSNVIVFKATMLEAKDKVKAGHFKIKATSLWGRGQIPSRPSRVQCT